MSATDLPTSITCISIMYFADDTVKAFIPETAYIGDALKDGSTSITLTTSTSHPSSREPVTYRLAIEAQRHVLATKSLRGELIVRVVLPDSKIDLHVTSVFAQEYWLSALIHRCRASSPISPRSPGVHTRSHNDTDLRKRRGHGISNLQITATTTAMKATLTTTSTNSIPATPNTVPRAFSPPTSGPSSLLSRSSEL